MSAAEEIRARYIEVLAQALAQTDPCRCEPSMLTGEASRLADALAAAGLLPTIAVTRPKTIEMHSLAMTRQVIVGMERAYATEWREVADPMSERDMGSW